MAKIVGIEFKEVGKIYWFSPDPFRLKKHKYRDILRRRFPPPEKHLRRASGQHQPQHPPPGHPDIRALHPQGRPAVCQRILP